MRPVTEVANGARRALLLARNDVNGIDFVEAEDDDGNARLRIHFLKPLPGRPGGVPRDAPPLTTENILVEGGVIEDDIRATRLDVDASGRVLTAHLTSGGDSSTYRLLVVASRLGRKVLDGFDPILSHVSFRFGADAAEGAPAAPTAREEARAPFIDYLARDYESLRRIILDRVGLLAPGWTERNPADVGVALVEILAHAADRLSYYQDAVATEAYLGTARRRVSVRRHARLLDYAVHDGSNARAWVAMEVDAPGVVGPSPEGEPLRFLTRFQERTLVDDATWQGRLHEARREVFEPVSTAYVHPAHDRIRLHDWGEAELALPRGATSATLVDADARLRLRAGDVICFEEALGPATGRAEDADPHRRHVVRLVRVRPEAVASGEGRREPPSERLRDPLTQTPLVEVEWTIADALPFDLVVRTAVRGASVGDVTVVRGNVVLVDHGRTLSCEEVGALRVPGDPRDGLALDHRHVTRATPEPPARLAGAPAAELLLQDPSETLPAVKELRIGGAAWTPRRDLLESGRADPDFVIESETDGASVVRFGDGATGRAPPPDARVRASYRVGNGLAGNVGAESIVHVRADGRWPPIRRAWNPLPAQGGVDPEAIEDIRARAPEANRSTMRAVTLEDHAEIARRHPDVRNATARRAWTGTWATTFVTVEPRPGVPCDAAFLRRVRAFLRGHLLAGHDIEILPPRYVPLDVVLGVGVAAGHPPAAVVDALLREFSDRDLPGGRGFFHPESFTFGTPVHLSQMVARAMRVPGVRWIRTPEAIDGRLRFQRFEDGREEELRRERIDVGSSEIVRVANDPRRPYEGRIAFVVEDGEGDA